MNIQLYSAKRISKVLLIALVLTSMLYSALPATPVYATSYEITDGSDPTPGSIVLGDGLCDSNPIAAGQQCTLREAIMESNLVNDIDAITFNPGLTMPIVLTEGALPTIANPLSIDGTTYNDLVTIDGNGDAIIGLDIQSPNVSVTGLVLVNFGDTAIRISNGANGTVVDGNYIGVLSDGVTDGQNLEKGIRVVDSSNVHITNNLISGNDIGGIYASGAASNGLIIQGNIIGLNLDKDTRLEDTSTSGADGIRLVNVTNAAVGGSGSLRNYISGNYGNGIVVTGVSTGTDINNNYIGLNFNGEAAIPNLNNGVRLNNASGVSIGSGQGNRISGNDSTAIVIANSTESSVENNAVGLDVDEDTIIANQGNGLSITASSVITVDNNVFSGNTGSGVVISSDSSEVTLTRNWIGRGAGGASVGNGGYGIYIGDSHDNIIGSDDSAFGNIIAHNGNDGVYVSNSAPDSSNGNAIVGNSIYSNTGLGIDLAPNGVTANDYGTQDGDTGANTLQNFVTFTAQLTETGVHIVGELDTDPLRPNYRLEFFVNNSCDSSGNGEGSQFLHAEELAIISDVTPLDFEIPTGSVSAGEYMTATVTYDELTGGLKDTSEFSPCEVVQDMDSPGSSGVFVVNSTLDTAEAGGQIGDGSCNVGGGICTLRAAIQEVNTGTEPPYTITFDIPGGDPQTINLTSVLPTISVPVLIKGKPVGDTGAPDVILDGSGAGGNGFTVAASNTKIDGLSLVNFSGSAVQINVANVSITNNYIGILPDGTTTGGNQTGVNINGTTAATISGNVISANTNGIRLVGSGADNNIIKSNKIGTNFNGTVDKGNTNDGIRIEGGSQNIIGGLSSLDSNTISSNGNDGIEITGGGSANKIYYNNIGVSSNGTGALGNSGHGVNINTSSDNVVTYSNVIAYNGSSGVYVSNGNRNLISENSIYNNASLGIELANGGNDSTPAPSNVSALQGGDYIFVEGLIVGAKSNSLYTVEIFYNPSGSFQGQTLIYTNQTSTDGAGNGSFGWGVFGTFPGLGVITANIRDNSNNTSQFSSPGYVANTAPTLTPSPTATFTATSTATASNTPENTATFTPSNTSVPANTATPTNTSTGSGGGSNPTATLKNTNTPTITETPTITPTATLISQFQTLTALATANTIEPTSTLETPTVTLVPTQGEATASATPAELAQAQTSTAEAVADGSGGGTDADAQADDGASGLLGGDNQLVWILYIFIGLAVLLLLIGGGMELMRWMNSRE